jgi:hypothetical protein
MKKNNAFRLLPAVAGLCAALPCSALAATAVLTADATLNASSPGTNYGASPTLAVSPSPGTTGMASLLRFDLSSLPTNLTSGTVNKATLSLWVATLSGSGALDVRAVASSFPLWTETGVTQNGFGTSSTVSATPRTATLGAAKQWVTVDVTDIVKDWLDAPSSNLGLYLQANVAASFDSKENSTTSHPPVLEIDTTGSAANFTGALAGDITGTQGATVVSQVGGSTAASLHAAEQAANAATNANTAGTLVKRDANGDFAAGTLTANLAGNATTATTAGNVSGTVGLAHGGTGATTAEGARNALLPNQTGSAGQVLTTDGANVAWGSRLLPWVIVSDTSQAMAPNTGYLATNVGPTTLTLPASPSIGDIVRVAGLGAGGWKLIQNANQTISGLPSVPGLVWIPRDSDKDWQAIASSSDGSKLVAAVVSGQIYTSTDSGATWTARDSSRNWSAVASSSDGAHLAAAVNGGQIYTSIDSGFTWTARDSNRDWSAVASSSDGLKLAAVVYGGQIYTSTNRGFTWAARDSSRNWTAVASSSDGAKLAAAVYNGQIYTSTDSGTTWTARDSNRLWRDVASSSDGAKLAAAVYGGQIYTSTDSGATWTARDSDREWTSMASSSDGAKLVAGTLDGRIYTSTDSGVTWTARDSRRNWYAVASSSDGAKLVASSRQIYTSSSTGTVSTTAGTTGFVIGDRGATLELMYVGNNQFMSLSHEGGVYAQ